MSIKRRFTDEEIEDLVKRCEGTTVGQLAREIGVNKNTLYSNINRYKKNKKYKEQIAEMRVRGMEMLDICKELKIGLEEGESILAAFEGREPNRILRKWTYEQKEQMYQMQRKGKTANEIAQVFNTTPMKVYKTIELHISQKRKNKAKKNAQIREEQECIAAENEILKPKPKKEKYKGPSIAELNKQAKMHNLTYGQYIAMKEMGLCQES